MSKEAELLVWVAIYLTIFAGLSFWLSGTLLWVIWLLLVCLVTALDFFLRLYFLGRDK